MSEALFRLEAGRYLPTDRARGPWSPDALHGSPVAALLAHVVEQERPAGLELARLTVDLCRPVPFARSASSSNDRAKAAASPSTA